MPETHECEGAPGTTTQFRALSEDRISWARSYPLRLGKGDSQAVPFSLATNSSALLVWLRDTCVPKCIDSFQCLAEVSMTLGCDQGMIVPFGLL